MMYNERIIDMNMRIKKPHDNKVMVDIEELSTMLSVGKRTADKIGHDAGAVVRIGKRKLYKTAEVIKYVDTYLGEDES